MINLLNFVKLILSEKAVEQLENVHNDIIDSNPDFIEFLKTIILSENIRLSKKSASNIARFLECDDNLAFEVT